MNILITGGTGFVGSRLALKCIERGDSVKVLGRENSITETENRKAIEARGSEVVLGSIIDRDKVFRLMKGIDIVYHLAAAFREVNVSDHVFWDVNVAGTRNVLDACVNAHVRRFVFTSTAGVHGSASEGKIDEQSPIRPNNIYEITKFEAEKLVLSFQKTLPVVIIRISEAYGPGDRKFLKLYKAIYKKTFFMVGPGNNMHHPIFIDDLIDGLFLAAAVEKSAGQVFILAGKESLTTNDMVSIIADKLGTNMPWFRIPLSPFLILADIIEWISRPLGIRPPIYRRRMDFFRKNNVFSMNKSARILGFIPKYTFCDGVSETVRWYKEMKYL